MAKKGGITLGAADADRLASHFGRAPEEFRALVGLDVATAANQLALGEAELTAALGANAAAAEQRVAQAKADEPAPEKKASPRKKATAKRSAKKA